VKETDTEIRIELAADVLFDFDKAEIRPSAQDALGRAASIIRDRGGRTVRVEGHTDAKGYRTRTIASSRFGAPSRSNHG